MCVCMYVCMYACMHACMHACLDVSCRKTACFCRICSLHLHDYCTCAHARCARAMHTQSIPPAAQELVQENSVTCESHLNMSNTDTKEAPEW